MTPARLFLAIELPDEARAHLVQLRDHLKSEISKASFTRDENLHITLKFLGEVEPRRMDELIESLSRVRMGGAIELFAGKIECFPHRGPIRIVAGGFGGDLTGVKALHRAIEQRSQHLGFDRETREYLPHATLARARPTLPPSLRKTMEESASSSFPGPRFLVNSFALFQSHLRPQGSKYEVLKRFEFASA